MLAVLDASRHSDQKGQNAQGARSDQHVQQRDAELVGAVRFFLVETRRTMQQAVTPQGGTDAGIQLRAPDSKTVRLDTNQQTDQQDSTYQVHVG